jgi:hypothetical protein
MASFMRKRISAESGAAKPQFLSRGSQKTLKTGGKNANDHEQQVRVHPALPYYSVAVPAPELC